MIRSFKRVIQSSSTIEGAFCGPAMVCRVPLDTHFRKNLRQSRQKKVGFGVLPATAGAASAAWPVAARADKNGRSWVDRPVLIATEAASGNALCHLVCTIEPPARCDIVARNTAVSAAIGTTSPPFRPSRQKPWQDIYDRDGEDHRNGQVFSERNARNFRLVAGQIRPFDDFQHAGLRPGRKIGLSEEGDDRIVDHGFNTVVIDRRIVCAQFDPHLAVVARNQEQDAVVPLRMPMPQALNMAVEKLSSVPLSP